MVKFLKRKAPDDEDIGSTRGSSSSSSKSQKTGDGAPVTLIVCPGAGGTLAKAMEEKVLVELARKHNFPLNRLNGIKWVTLRAGHDSNVGLITAQFPADRDFYLMGNSFGNRVLCEMLGAGKVPSRCRGVIFCGFPLYGEKNVPDRVNQLKLLSKAPQIKTLVISGTEDEFLNRDFLTAKGAALMQKTHSDLGLPISRLVMLENGLHDVPKCKGAKAKDSTERAAQVVIREIREFCA